MAGVITVSAYVSKSVIICVGGAVYLQSPEDLLALVEGHVGVEALRQLDGDCFRTSYTQAYSRSSTVGSDPSAMCSYLKRS
jgi:hypothetical protein